MTFWKKQNYVIQTVRRLVVTGVREKGGWMAEDGGILGQWKFSEWFCMTKFVGYKSLYIC